MRKTVYFMLLCFSVLFISCSEDDRYQLSEPEKLENGFKRSTINFGEMKERLSDRMYSLESLKIISQKDGDSTYIQSIDSTHIIVFSNDTLTTYTMKVSTLDDENYSLSNLVIKTEGDVTEEYVIHYNPTPEWQAAHESGEYLPYEGELSMVSIEGDTVTEQRSSLMICSFSVEPIYDCNTCMGRQIIGYDITIHCYTVPGSGGGGGGPGPGPGGPGPGPGEGGGSGNGGDDPGLPTDPNYGGDITPCQALTMKKNDPFFIDKINFLKEKVNTTPFEHGFVNHNPIEDPNINSNATNQYSPTVSVMEVHCLPSADMQIEGAHVFGYMHTHPGTSQCPDSMGIHSVPDIREFMSILRRRHSMNYSLHDAYGIVVGGHGIYALKLDDSMKFNNWLLNIDTRDKSNKYFEDMKEKYKEINDHPNSRNENEKAILKLLNQFYSDLGIGLYRAVEVNGAMTGWERMTLNENNNPAFTNCNQL